MTKFTACIFIYLTCIILIAHAALNEKYSDRYDSIDVEAVLANPRIRTQYLNCVTGTSPCRTGAERFLKDHFAEAYITKCKKCTDRQVYFFDTVASWFANNDPETWNRVVKMILDDLRNKNT